MTIQEILALLAAAMMGLNAPTYSDQPPFGNKYDSSISATSPTAYLPMEGTPTWVMPPFLNPYASDRAIGGQYGRVISSLRQVLNSKNPTTEVMGQLNQGLAARAGRPWSDVNFNPMAMAPRVPMTDGHGRPYVPAPPRSPAYVPPLPGPEPVINLDQLIRWVERSRPRAGMATLGPGTSGAVGTGVAPWQTDLFPPSSINVPSPSTTISGGGKALKSGAASTAAELVRRSLARGGPSVY